MKNPFKKKEDKWEEEVDERISELRTKLVIKHGLSHIVVGDIMKETTRFVRDEVIK